jgi:broad specificity phosphatase PhoE
MPMILLVRHGQASFGMADYDVLSPAGQEQSEALAGELAGRELHVERIVSGSLRRQQDTAAPAAARLHREVVVDPRWNEYDMDAILAAHSTTSARASAGPGSASVSTAEFQDLLEQALAAWITAGESSAAPEPWPAFGGRVRSALLEIADSLPSGSTALAFTSGGVVAAICAAALKLPEHALIAFNRVSVNTGITKLVSGGRGISMVSFNDHAHLERRRPPLITYR